jgi:hypothetical protein
MHATQTQHLQSNDQFRNRRALEGLAKCDRRAQVVTAVTTMATLLSYGDGFIAPESLPVDVNGKRARIERYGVMEKAIFQNTLDLRHDQEEVTRRLRHAHD